MAFYRGRHSPFQIYRFHGISASISGHPLRPTTFLHSMVLVAQGTLARTSSGIRRENCLFWKVLLLNSRGSAGAFPRRRINQPRRNMNAYPPLSLSSLYFFSVIVRLSSTFGNEGLPVETKVLTDCYWDSVNLRRLRLSCRGIDHKDAGIWRFEIFRIIRAIIWEKIIQSLDCRTGSFEFL